jgi:beta-glucosidase
VSACLSVPTLDEKAWRASEPRTPNPRARLEAVAELNRAGIPTGILIAPLMPGINDDPKQVEKIVELAMEAGAVHIGGQTLFLRGSVREVFFDFLRNHRPELLERYERLYGGPLADQRNGDLPIIAEPIDFLGVNYYFPQRVFAARDDGPLRLRHAPPPPPTTARGWEVDPNGLHELLLRLRRDYGPLPVYITENGASFDDPPATEGLVEDPQRTAYLRGHLEALARAVADGVDVRRYCVWSLLDNFEWEHGYDKRFGIVHVDYRTQRRSVKRSGLWYRDFIAWMRRLRH